MCGAVVFVEHASETVFARVGVDCSGVPIEVGDALFLKLHQECLLGARERIEAHEDDAAVGQIGAPFASDTLHDVARDHTLVAAPPVGELSAEIEVDVVQDVPDAEEGSAVAIVLGVGTEGGPEAADSFDLFRLEIREIFLELVEMAGVGEELACVNEIVVDIVEVAEQHFAPVDEIVERFLLLAASDIDMVEEEEHLQVIRRLERAELLEETVEGEDGRGEHRSAYGLRKVFAKEEASTAVGEDEGHLLHISTIGIIKTFGNLLKKGSHGQRKTKSEE